MLLHGWQDVALDLEEEEEEQEPDGKTLQYHSWYGLVPASCLGLSFCLGA